MRNRKMGLDEIIAVMERPNTPPKEKRHSPVYEALWHHYDLLQPELSFPRQPNWPDVATKLAARGITNSLGEAATGEVVRKTWWKVGRDKERLAAGVKRTRRPAATKSAEEAPAPAAQPARAPASVAPPPPEDGDSGLLFAGGPKRWKDPDK